MPQVNVTVNGRDYAIACDEGEQDHLKELASHVDATPAGPQTLKQGEGTVMLGIDVGKNFELRPEIRADFASSPNGVDIFAGGTKSSEVTGELAALTWF